MLRPLSLCLVIQCFSAHRPDPVCATTFAGVSASVPDTYTMTEMSIDGVICIALLQDALDITMKMALSIPLADIMAYRKVGKAFFGLLEVLAANHTAVIAACDTPTFAFLMTGAHSCFLRCPSPVP